MKVIVISIFLILLQPVVVSTTPCGSPPEVSNAIFVIEETPAGNNTAKYTCESDDGIMMQGNDTIVCVNLGDHSTWSSINFTCKRVQCNSFPAVDNFTTNVEYMEYVQINSQTIRRHKLVYYGGNMTVRCKFGFELPDGSSKSEVICGADGKWTNPPAVCQPMDCGDVPEMPGVICDVTATIVYSTVICECKVGHERNYTHLATSRRDHYFTRTCSQLGTWTHPDDLGVASCTRVQCPVPSRIPNMASLSYEGHSYGDNATYTCKQGFEDNSNGKIWCRENKTWSDTISCFSSTACGQPPVISNATAVIDNTTTPLITAKYTCDSQNGFVLQGNDTIYCETVADNSRWSSVNFTCKRVQCDDFPDVNTTTTLISNGISSRNTITYYGGNKTVSCKDGYEYPGGNTTYVAVCGADGNWIYSTTACQPKDCGQVEELSGVTCNVTSSKYPNVIYCRCKVGHERWYYTTTYRYRQVAKLSFSLSCLSSGQWNRPSSSGGGECFRVECPAPDTVSNMLSVTYDGHGYEDIATYTCIRGYETNLNNTIWCQANKTWSHSVRCVPKDCGPALQINNGGANHFIDDTTFGAVVTYSCNRGYKLYGSHTIRCREFGTWSEGPICHRVNCNEPPVTENAKRVIVGNYYNDVTTYQCNHGYTLVGNSTIYCEFDGHWTASPNCHEISCGAPPEVQHSSFKIPSGYNFGDHVEYACPVGYSLQGVSFVTCLSSGNWSKAPTCVSSGNTTESQKTNQNSDSAPVSTTQGPSILSAQEPSISNKHKYYGLLVGCAISTTIVLLLAVIFSCYGIHKYRKKRAHFTKFSTQALFNNDEETTTIYSSRSQSDLDN